MLKQTADSIKSLKKITDEFVVIHDSALDVCNSNNNAILPALEILVGEETKDIIFDVAEIYEHVLDINNLDNQYEYDIVVLDEHIYYVYTKVGHYDYNTISKHEIKKYEVVVSEPEELLVNYLDYSRAPYLIVEQRAYLSLLVYLEELTDEEIGVYYRYVRNP